MTQDKKPKSKVIELNSRRVGSVEYMTAQVEQLLADVKAGGVSALVIATISAPGYGHHGDSDREHSKNCQGHYDVVSLIVGDDTERWTARDSALLLGLSTFAQQAVLHGHGFIAPWVFSGEEEE